MSIFESLENLAVSEACFDEIMDMVEAILDEGRQEGESLTQYKSRLAGELGKKFKEQLASAIPQAEKAQAKSDELGHIHSKTLNHSNADKHQNPPRNSKAGAKLEKAIRTANAWFKANDEMFAADKKVNTLNKKLDKVSSIKSNADVQLKN